MKNSGLPNPLIILLFLIKVFAGLFIGWASLKLYPQGSDYVLLSNEGWKEFIFLKSDPLGFIKDLFQSPYGHYGGFFSSSDSYWNNLRNNILIKAVAVFNILSNGNFYINSMFFNSFGFFGHVALYKIFVNIYSRKKNLVLIGAFLIPSTLYFSSALQKDNVIFLMTALFSYALYFNSIEFKYRRLLLLILAAIIILFIRNYVLFALIPASFAFILSRKTKWAYTITYTALLIILICLSFIPALNPLQIIANKQHAFFNLDFSNSKMVLGYLEPSLKSFFNNFPQVFVNIFLNPMPWNFSSAPGIALGIEWILFLSIFIYFLFNRELIQNRTFVKFSILFAFTIFLLVGYVVPNLGSLIRYRSIYLPYLIIPLICSINLKQIKFKNM
ncbi:MAG: hypothetical protein ABIP68_03555 [Ferruginibacter sp.]